MANLMDIKVERNVAIPMRDGTVLRADIFRPEPEGDYPVLLTRTPYNKSVANLAYSWLQPIRPASEGYVVVVQDVRGRFESEGKFQPFHQEIDDGFDTVEWCARQPWSNGRVGMYGISYLGATQWLAAASQAPNLQCIFPSLTGSDYYDGWTYRGGAFELGFNLTWAALLLGLPEVPRLGLSPDEVGAAMGALAPVAANPFGALNQLPIGSASPFANPKVAPYYREWLEHPTRDAFWEPVTIEAAHPRIHTPAFNLGGWYDLFQRGTLRNYSGMRANGASEVARQGQKLIVGPWSHGATLTAGVGSRVFGASSQVLLEDLHMRWFDKWLKDRDTGIDSEPPVRVFTMGVNRWDTYADWPPPEAKLTRYYLHSNGAANTMYGDGVLNTDAPGAERPDHFVYDPLNPAPTVGGALFPYPLEVPPGPFDQAKVEQRADVLCYSTPPLDRDTQVTGTIEATLWVASSEPDTDFTAKLVDVFPDGSSFNLTDGIIRARYRNGFERGESMTPGEPVQVTIDLAGTSNVFAKGHRIRLEVSSSNFPRFDRNTNTGAEIAKDPEARVAMNTCLHDANHPSFVTLPVVGSG